MSSEKNVPQEKDWWEQEDKGYNTDNKVKTEFPWGENTKKMIKERLGVVDKDTGDDSRIFAGDKQENYEYDGEEKIVDESKEEVMTMTMTRTPLPPPLTMYDDD